MGPQLPVAHSWIIERIGSIHCRIVLRILVSKCQLATDRLYCNLFYTTIYCCNSTFLYVEWAIISCVAICPGAKCDGMGGADWLVPAVCT